MASIKFALNNDTKVVAGPLLFNNADGSSVSERPVNNLAYNYNALNTTVPLATTKAGNK